MYPNTESPELGSTSSPSDLKIMATETTGKFRGETENGDAIGRKKWENIGVVEGREIDLNLIHIGGRSEVDQTTESPYRNLNPQFELSRGPMVTIKDNNNSKLEVPTSPQINTTLPNKYSPLRQSNQNMRHNYKPNKSKGDIPITHINSPTSITKQFTGVKRQKSHSPRDHRKVPVVHTRFNTVTHSYQDPIAEAGTLRTKLANMQKKFDALESQHKKISHKYENISKESRKWRQRSDQLEREYMNSQSLLTKMASEKAESNNKLQQNKEYIRKLEQTITKGPKGQILSEVNQKLKDNLDVLRKENQTVNIQIGELHRVIEEREMEIRVLTATLDLKADDFKLKGDTRSALLYDVGANRTKVKELNEQLSNITQHNTQLKQRLNEEELQNEELRIIRESNNEEMIKMENDLHNIGVERNSFQESSKELARERMSLLDYIEELNEKLAETAKRYESELDSWLKEKGDLTAQISGLDKNFDLERLKVKNFDKEIDILQEQKGNLELEFRQERERHYELEKQSESIITKNKEFQIENERRESMLLEMRQEVKRVEGLNTEINQKYYDLKFNYEKILQKNKEIENTLQYTLDTHMRTETLLKEKMEGNLNELQNMAKERSILKENMAEAINKCQDSLYKQMYIQEEKTKVEEQVSNLKNSKSVLHKTMSDQITALKAQLSQVKYEKEQAEGQRETEKRENEGLDMKIRTEQMKNRALLEEVRNLKDNSWRKAY